MFAGRSHNCKGSGKPSSIYFRFSIFGVMNLELVAVLKKLEFVEDNEQALKSQGPKLVVSLQKVLKLNVKMLGKLICTKLPCLNMYKIAQITVL